jgi:SAM-dependent methyltransferase
MLREEDTKEYWDKKWAFGEGKRERMILDGSDGEAEFDRELLRMTIGKTILDVGCGNGRFLLKIAKNARHVKGIDISTTALAQAKNNVARSKLGNVEFRMADARRLLFSNDSFDIVYSRRGPGSDSVRTLSEAYRVLRKKGAFMEITIGERDKENIARIFGRGQMLKVRGQVSDIKRSMLARAGFKRIVTRDYLGTEVFKGMSDLLVRLQSAPIIPSFDLQRDRKYLKKIKEDCMTDRGIETPVHRVILIARKTP